MIESEMISMLHNILGHGISKGYTMGTPTLQEAPRLRRRAEGTGAKILVGIPVFLLAICHC